LIKIIWYPPMWRYIWQHFSFVPSTTLKFVSVWSKHPRIFFGRLRQSSVIFGNLPKIFGNVRKMSGNVRLPFGTTLENLRKSSESDWKSSENRQKRHVYIIKSILHVSSKIWILCSRGKNYISLVRCAHSWHRVLATRT